MMYYLYSIALIAASGRLKLNRLPGSGPTLGLKSAGPVQGLPWKAPLARGLCNRHSRKNGGSASASGSPDPGMGDGLPTARGRAVEVLLLNHYKC